MGGESSWLRPRSISLGRRRLIAALTAGGAGTALLACSKKNASPATPATNAAAGGQAPRSGGTFNAFVQYNPVLDPQRGSAGNQNLASGAYSRVFRYKTGPDPHTITNHELESDLGVSAESPDAVTWTVKLRPGAKFSNTPPVNGHAVEAEDIKATYVRALTLPENPNRGAITMIDASQIETPDPQTVVFKLNYPFAPFRQTLASPAYSWIYPREVLAGGYDPVKTMIGSGPFTLESPQPDVAYSYKKNPNYFDSAHVYLDGFRFVVIPDAQQQLAQFSTGALDELWVETDGVDPAKRNNPRAAMFRVDDGRPFPIYFQLGDPASPFQDIRVRQAVSQAIDRDTLGKLIWNGQGQFTLFVPSFLGKWAIQLGDLDPTTRQLYTYDPANAKKLLQAAGATDLQLKFAYVTNSTFTTPNYVKQSETVSNMLNVVGIKTTLVQQDFNKDFINGGKGSKQGYFDKDTLLYGSTVTLADADELLYSYFYSNSTQNTERLKDPTLDAMLAKERTLVNEDERLKAVLDIEKYIAQKIYAVPTAGSYRFVFVQPRVQNYQVGSLVSIATDTYAKLWLSG